MPWKEVRAMDSRIQFISEALKGDRSISDICLEYNISRKTGYKWLKRFELNGIVGIKEQSKSPKDFYNKVSIRNIELIFDLRNQHPYWGAPKIKAYLSRRYEDLPSVSSIGRILRKAGLTRPSKGSVFKVKRSKLTQSESPNHVWSADYKGQFKTNCGTYNFPLTIADNYSRYLIGIHNLRKTSLIDTKKAFTKSFKEYGLPDIIRTDNGVPFCGANGPSQLSIWWLELGIKPELTEKGKPQQNGRHERMHRVLSEEAIDVKKYNFNGQSKAFKKYKNFYNSDRPHLGINNKTPSEIYHRSKREMPNKIKEYEYPKYVEVRKIGSCGKFQFLGNRYFLSNAFQNKYMGLTPIGEDIWELNFRGHKVGTINTYYKTLNGVYLGD